MHKSGFCAKNILNRPVFKISKVYKNLHLKIQIQYVLDMKKNLAVLYVFHEYNDRVQHFLENCIFYDQDIDWFIISNNKSNVFSVPDYAKTIFRDNIGYDFGGWSDALIKYGLHDKYENYIFANSSIIGPFIPSYCKTKWTDIYLDGLKDNIKIFGSTINTSEIPLRESHVQSYIFAMDSTTLKFLIDCDIFSISNYAKNFNEAICHKEILMSLKIIENGGNIGSLHKYYEGVDFTFSSKKPSDYNIYFANDIMKPHQRGVLWNEHELVFIKGNRIPLNLASCSSTNNLDKNHMIDGNINILCI
jgi:hypothetical protein